MINKTSRDKFNFCLLAYVDAQTLGMAETGRRIWPPPLHKAMAGRQEGRSRAGASGYRVWGVWAEKRDPGAPPGSKKRPRQRAE